MGMSILNWLALGLEDLHWNGAKNTFSMAWAQDIALSTRRLLTAVDSMRRFEVKMACSHLGNV
jgi:hypothetical protein